MRNFILEPKGTSRTRIREDGTLETLPISETTKVPIAPVEPRFRIGKEFLKQKFGIGKGKRILKKFRQPTFTIQTQPLQEERKSFFFKSTVENERNLFLR